MDSIFFTVVFSLFVVTLGRQVFIDLETAKRDDKKVTIDFLKDPKVIGLIVFIPLLFFLGLKPLYSNYFGEEQIGAYFEKFNYSTRYYVNIFPDDSKSKNYKVEADITRVNDQCEDCVIHYDVEKVYWPNSGTTTFSECIFEDSGKEERCLDTDQKFWTVKIAEKVQ